MTRPWDSLSAEQAEHAFNPQKSVPDSQRFGAARAPLNEAARQQLDWQEIAFGPGPLHRLDLFRPRGNQAPAPVHLFYHGGYWRAQDKANFAALAAPLVSRGVMVAMMNYDLCPAVTLDGTVQSALDGFAFVARHVAQYGGDAARLTLSGHSAGAHLGAAILAQDWAAQGLPADVVKGALLISGIYDPRAVMRTSVNAEVRLDEATAARHDYEAAPVQARCPVTVIAGGAEPWPWVQHSLRYAEHLTAQGLQPRLVVTPGCHHFDILEQYLQPESDIAIALARLC